MIEVAGLKKKFKLTKDHKKNKVDDIDPREDKDFFHEYFLLICLKNV